jgi:isoleucyl-tRNA synthetase
MLLGLIDDLEPEHLVPRDQLEPIDRLALMKFDDVARTIVTAYETYRLHDVYLTLIAYDTEDLSRFYIDVLKDPMYSGARDGKRRRSAQTAIFTILRGLCALTAPLLSFTAEESGNSCRSVCAATRFPYSICSFRAGVRAARMRVSFPSGKC